MVRTSSYLQFSAMVNIIKNCGLAPKDEGTYLSELSYCRTLNSTKTQDITLMVGRWRNCQDQRVEETKLSRVLMFESSVWSIHLSKVATAVTSKNTVSSGGHAWYTEWSWLVPLESNLLIQAQL